MIHFSDKSRCQPSPGTAFTVLPMQGVRGLSSLLSERLVLL
jgi:hypothetical protein